MTLGNKNKVGSSIKIVGREKKKRKKSPLQLFERFFFWKGKRVKKKRGSKNFFTDKLVHEYSKNNKFFPHAIKKKTR